LIANADQRPLMRPPKPGVAGSNPAGGTENHQLYRRIADHDADAQIRAIRGFHRSTLNFLPAVR
jgi:hypothetical protein